MHRYTYILYILCIIFLYCVMYIYIICYVTTFFVNILKKWVCVAVVHIFVKETPLKVSLFFPLHIRMLLYELGFCIFFINICNVLFLLIF